MVTAGDFKNGLTIQFENNIYQIIEFQHVKPGKGAAFVRCKLKNIKNGGVVEVIVFPRNFLINRTVIDTADKVFVTERVGRLVRNDGIW